MKHPKILISGYYGFDNFGDDAILLSLVSSIKKELKDSSITVISNNPKQTSETYKVNSVYKFDCLKILSKMVQTDLFISGGGSLLQDVTSFKSLIYYLGLIFLALILNKKVFIFAQGIGPIKSKFGRFLTIFALKKVRTITVRDEESYYFLKKHKLNPILTSDPVWDLNFEDYGKKTAEAKEKKTVGIELREWHLLTDEKIAETAKSVADNFSDRKIILFSVQDNSDLKPILKLKENLEKLNKNLNIEVKKGLSVQETVELTAGLDFLIAMRYHPLLIGVRFGILNLPLSYDPKVTNLAEECGLPYLEINDILAEEMTKKVQNLIKNSEFFEKKMQVFSTENQLKTRQNFDLVHKIIR